MILSVARLLGVTFLLAGGSSACQVPHATDRVKAAAFQLDPSTDRRFVDVGETDRREAIQQLGRQRRQLSAAKDVIGCNRLDAKEAYLRLLQSYQSGRMQLRRGIERMEGERSEADRHGKADAVAELDEQIARERLRLEESRRVLVVHLSGSMPDGFGSFLLDLRALEDHQLEALVVQLDERAGAYRSTASMTRANIARQEHAKGRNEKKLQELQAWERFANQMAADFAELSRLIRSGEVDAAQALADRRWAEVLGA